MTKSLAKLLVPALVTIAAVSTLQAQTLVGSWLFGDPSTNAGAINATFFANGYYMLSAETTSNTALEKPGMERGSYLWNSGTGSFSTTVLRDTNGTDLGFSGNSGSPNISFLDANTIHFVDGSNDITLSRVTGASALVGSWLFGDPSTNAGVINATFFSNGYYMLSAETTSNTALEAPGMERGSYLWNSGDGSFSTTVLRDTNGTDLGFSGNSGSPNISFLDANTIHFVDGSNDITLSRIGAIPEPSTYAALAGTFGLAVALWRHRSARARF